VKVLRSNSTDQVFETQEFKPRLHHVGPDVDHFCRDLVADSSRDELHRPPCDDAEAVHVLQLRFPDLLVDGVVLYPVHRHDAALLANLSRDSPEGAQVGRRVGAVATAPHRQDFASLGRRLRRSGVAPPGRAIGSGDRRARVPTPAPSSRVVQLREAGRSRTEFDGRPRTSAESTSAREGDGAEPGRNVRRRYLLRRNRRRDGLGTAWRTYRGQRMGAGPCRSCRRIAISRHIFSPVNSRRRTEERFRFGSDHVQRRATDLGPSVTRTSSQEHPAEAGGRAAERRTSRRGGGAAEEVRHPV